VKTRGVQALAWSVLLGALCLWLVAVLGLPALGMSYARAATMDEDALVERREGSVTLARAGRTVLLEPSGLQSANAPEGTDINTLADGRAHVRLFDESTVNLEPGTKLSLVSSRRARFPWSDVAPHVVLAARPEGDAPARLSVGTTWHGTRLELRAGDAVVTMGPEAHARIATDGQHTTVHALSGAVTVAAGGRSVAMDADTMTTVAAGGPPLAPKPALTNLVVDGDFRRPLKVSWLVRAEGEPLGTARSIVEDGETILHMERTGSAGSPGDVVLEQSLGERDLSNASYLGLTVTLKIDHQSLAAGGQRDIEYPLMLKLVLERQDGSEDAPWEVGFYAADPAGATAPPAGLGVTGVPVPRGEWVVFGTGNLLDTSGSASVRSIEGSILQSPALDQALAAIERFGAPPLRLLRIEVKGSGHDWLSSADHLGLWTK
jgi:hypothetical protein